MAKGRWRGQVPSRTHRASISRIGISGTTAPSRPSSLQRARRAGHGFERPPDRPRLATGDHRRLHFLRQLQATSPASPWPARSVPAGRAGKLHGEVESVGGVPRPMLRRRLPRGRVAGGAACRDDEVRQPRGSRLLRVGLSLGGGLERGGARRQKRRRGVRDHHGLIGGMATLGQSLTTLRWRQGRIVHAQCAGSSVSPSVSTRRSRGRTRRPSSSR